VTAVRVASTQDVPMGECRVFATEGHSIALCNLNGEFYAVDNLCTHDNGPLGEGRIDRGTIECPRHGARFDVKTGAVKALPAVRPIKTYPVTVEGDEVRVDV
jgi:3-phenylpropionate/trans-cinnamate dioxygenase ferredoxin component